MKTMTKLSISTPLLTKLVMTALALLAVNASFASGIRKVSQKNIIKKATMICVLEVQRVESLEKFYHFKDGSKAKTATTTFVKGKVIKSLYGDCGKDVIDTRYHTRSTVGYVTDEQKKRYILIRTGSGKEHKVRQGETYIFTFVEPKASDKPLAHARMDMLSEEPKLVEMIKGKSQ